MKPQRIALGGASPKALQDWLTNHSRVLAGKVSFGGTIANGSLDRNIECSTANGISPGAANTDFTVKHTLGRIPVTIAGQDTNNGGLLYRSPVTAWTKTTATLRCTTATATYNVVLV